MNVELIGGFSYRPAGKYGYDVDTLAGNPCLVSDTCWTCWCIGFFFAVHSRNLQFLVSKLWILFFPGFHFQFWSPTHILTSLFLVIQSRLPIPFPKASPSTQLWAVYVACVMQVNDPSVFDVNNLRGFKSPRFEEVGLQTTSGRSSPWIPIITLTLKALELGYGPVRHLSKSKADAVGCAFLLSSQEAKTL